MIRHRMAAIGLAVLLSAACLLRGAVDDITIIVLLPITLGLAWMVTPVNGLKSTFFVVGLCVFSCLTIVLLLQYILPLTSPSAVHIDTLATLLNTPPPTLYDTDAWWSGIGRFLWITLIFWTAAHISQEKSTTHWFINSLLLSATCCIVLTFLIAKQEGAYERLHYTHGFVNANHAATYLGMMLLVTVACIAQLLQQLYGMGARSVKSPYDRWSGSNSLALLGFIFAFIVFLGGLWMTGSRGGIAASLLCLSVFTGLVMHRLMRARIYRRFTAALGLLFVAVLVWSFTHFGALFEHALQQDGLNMHERNDIYATSIDIIQDHPLLGSGLGSFEAIFQPYRPATMTPEGIINHAHNSYLHFALEMGVPALFIVVGCALAAISHGWHRWQRSRRLYALLGVFSLVLPAMHALVDLPLHIPALTALSLALAIFGIFGSERSMHKRNSS